MARVGNSDIIDVEVLMVAETPHAILVKTDEESEAVWLPKSQIEMEEKGRGVVEISAPEWLLIERRLEGAV